MEVITVDRSICHTVKGRALDLYQGLGHHHPGDYDALKITLIRGFGITADDMMENFLIIRLI